mgnify:CR=1 FL=1
MTYWFWSRFWKLAHRFDRHYMPTLGPLEDGRKQAWCRWCGLRDYVFDPVRARMEIRGAALMDEAQEPKP